MLVRAVFFFLIFMVVLAMFGKWRFPGQDRISSAKCPRCGKFRIGKSRCGCKKD
jgi:hypothetical protein